MKIINNEILGRTTHKNIVVEMEDGREIVAVHYEAYHENMAVSDIEVNVLDEGDQPKNEKEKDEIIAFIEENA